MSNSENDSSYYYSSAAVLKRSPPTAGLASSHTRSCLKLKQLPLFTCLKCDQQNASFTDSNYFFKIKNSSDMKERSAEHSSASSTPPPIQTQFKENSSSCKSNTTSSSSASFLSTDNNKSCDCSLTIDLESECYDDEQTVNIITFNFLFKVSLEDSSFFIQYNSRGPLNDKQSLLYF